MKPKIMFVELKPEGGSDKDPSSGYISRAAFSDNGRTVNWHGKKLKRSKTLKRGTHVDAETGEAYWVCVPKGNGRDCFPWGSARVEIDPGVREEYWKRIRNEPKRVKDALA